MCLSTLRSKIISKSYVDFKKICSEKKMNIMVSRFNFVLKYCLLWTYIKRLH